MERVFHMPTITSLQPGKRDPERVNVYLDGEFAFAAPLGVVMVRRLSEGQTLSEQEIEAIRQDDALDRAYAAALNFLSFRPRSRREIEQYFRGRKTELPLVDAVLERLERQGLVDDHAFATFWVENRQTFRPRGTRALRAEMRQKGLDNEVIDEALSAVDDEEPIAYEVGSKKARSYASLDEREFFRKMVGFLQRRGFPYETAARAARRIYTDIQEESG